MKAQDQINAVMGMNTRSEVEAVLTEEKLRKNPRKTVVNACEERIGELETNGGDTVPQNDTPENTSAPAGNDTQDGKDETPDEEVKKPTEIEKRIAEFKQKCGWNPQASVTRFAKEFWGDDLEVIKVKDYIVTVTLKSTKKKINIRVK